MEMNQRLLNVVAAVAMLAGSIGSAAPALAAPPGPTYRPVDVGPRLRDLSPSEVPLHLNGFEGAYEQAASSSTQPQEYVEGDVITAIWYDDLSGLYLAPFEVRAIGEHIEVWVMTDLNFPDGDPRNPVVITDEQIDYLVDEFDNTIYPQEVAFFGAPDFHDGSNAALPFDYYDPEGRSIAMIMNVGDENYYDPNYPLYIAGFYWGAVFELYLDRNVISIDAYDWENRVGDDAARPNLYEGVFAHEYQHLLHDDYDSDEENWVNEGLSDFAEFLVGYGHPDSHVRDTAALPENSLVVWEDQGPLEILSDYGHAYLYMLYLFEQFGGGVLQDLFLNPGNGIVGADAALSGESTTFADVYHQYAPGLYIEGTFNSLPDFSVDVGHPGKPNPEAFATPGAPPWGTDYHLMWGFESVKNLVFNGVQFNPTQWTSDGDVLWGGEGNLVDNFLIAEADLTGVIGASLNFDTMYEIEAGWDFGFVQVSTDGGNTWETIENAPYTTLDHEATTEGIIAQLPGLTGSSGGWINLTYDLSAYDGQDVLVAFRYMTDWAVNEEGWYIDNVDIAGVFSSDGSSTDGFQSLNEVLGISNDFTVQLVGERNHRGQSEYEVMTILSGGYMQDWAPIAEMFDNYRSLVLMVTYDAGVGVTSYADYSFDLISGGGKPK
jgi:hypothetical protein